MAVVRGQVYADGRGYKWDDLANGDTGQPALLMQHPDKHVHVTGTFGTGGSVTLQGSNDPDPATSNWVTMKDYDGNDLTFTAAGAAPMRDNFLLIRPSVTAGDGSTALDVKLALVPARR